MSAKLRLAARPFRRTSLASLLAALLVLPATASAQSATPSADSTELAREAFRRGTEAYRAGRDAEALAAFTRAHELAPAELEILRGLGAAEIRAGQLVAGARHLQKWLAESTRGSSEERAAIEALLRSTHAKLGRLRIDAQRPGTDILVNDEVVGTAPIEHEIYVAPGEHSVLVRRGELGLRRRISVSAGGREYLRMEAPEPLPVQPAEPATRPRPAPSESWQSAPGETAASRIDDYTAALLLGGELTIVGAGVGLAFAATSAQRSADARELEGSIAQRSGEGPCTRACGEAQRARSDASSNQAIAIVGFAGAGAAAIGTTAYVLWRSGQPPSRDSGARSAILVAGGALAAAGVASGIYFLADAAAGEDARKAALGSIPATRDPCGLGTPFIAECGAVFRESSERQRSHLLALTSFAAASGALATTLTYAFVRGPAGPQVGVGASPGGISVRGAF